MKLDVCFLKHILQINILCFSLPAFASIFCSGVGMAETVIKLQILAGVEIDVLSRSF